MAGEKIWIVEEDDKLSRDLEKRLIALGYEPSKFSPDIKTPIDPNSLPHLFVAYNKDEKSVQIASKLHEEYQIPLVYLSSTEKNSSLNSSAKINEVDNEKKLELKGIIDAISRLETSKPLVIASSFLKSYRKTFGFKNFYKYLIEKSGDLLKIINKEGIIVYVSSSLKKILGYEPNEVLGKNILSLIARTDFEKAKEGLRELNTKGTISYSQYKTKHKNGSIVHLEIIVSTVIENNNDSYFLFNCRNVSQRVEQEKNLKKLQKEKAKSEILFKKLAKLSPDIIYLYDLVNRKPLFCNRKFLFGYHAKSELQNILSLESVHPHDREMVALKHKDYLLPPFNVVKNIEYRIKNKNGKWEWLDERVVVAELDSLGFPTQLLSTTSIVTEKHKAQEEIENNRARIHALVENTKDFIWSIDKKYHLTAFNSNFKNFFNQKFHVTPNLGENLLQHFAPEDIEVWKPAYDQALNGETVMIELHREHENHYYEAWLNPIYGKEKITGVSCYLRDISHRKKMEMELKQSNFELDSFVYRSSHDMTAPLRSILGLIHILRMDLPKDEVKKYLDLVEKSVKKLDNFIQDLTSFSRNSRLPIVYQAVNFKNIIQTTLEELAFMPNAGRLDVKIKIEKHSPFYSDQSRVKIIFGNLISNAIKYQRLNIDHSYLSIDITIDEEKAIIEVTDNGKGIKDEYLDKIFEMFFRASEESFGSGLGLYILKQAVERLNGKIVKVKSVLGEGTTFLIMIPNHLKKETSKSST